MDRLSALFADQIQFSYTALDRIVLNGYIQRLQREANLVHFFHEVAAIPCIEPKDLSARTDRYRAWVRSFTDRHQIPVFAAPKGQRKEDLVLPFYRRLHQKEGVACVLTSMEQNSTFTSYAPRFATADPNYRIIRRCRKQFLHYYFYVFDDIAGPMSLRLATYFPFNLTCYLNGHSFIAQELQRLGVRFRKEDNAFFAVDDVAALEGAARQLTPELLRERCDYWAGQLAPVFSDDERAALDLSYRYSVSQLEIATDVIFKRSATLKARFARAVELGLLLGGADRTTNLFGRRINRRHRGKLETVLDRRDEGHLVLRSYYQSSFVKLYEKGGRLLRAEACANNTYHFGIGRRLANLPTLVERLTATAHRYLESQAELLDSSVDTGTLAQLATPTVLPTRRVPGIKLEDDRVVRLLDAVLHPAGFLTDWTTRDLQARVCKRAGIDEADYRLSQLRYDLGKLRAKGLVQRLGKTRRYQLTDVGLKVGTLVVKLRTRLIGPLYSQAAEPPRTRSHHPGTVEAAIRQVDVALDRLCRALGVRAA